MQEERTLTYPEFQTLQRTQNYMRRLTPHNDFDPHNHAARASKGLKVQARIRGLGTKAKALWQAIGQ